MVATGVIVPFAILALMLGIATLWIGYTLDWTLLRWPVAFVADLLVVSLPIRAAAGSTAETTTAVLGVELALVTVDLASIAVRTIVRRRDVNMFEILQATAALAIGFGGAGGYVARDTMSAVIAVSLATLVFGVGCYGVAFAFVRQGRPRNFYFYTSFGLAIAR